MKHASSRHPAPAIHVRPGRGARRLRPRGLGSVPCEDSGELGILLFADGTALDLTTCGTIMRAWAQRRGVAFDAGEGRPRDSWIWGVSYLAYALKKMANACLFVLTLWWWSSGWKIESRPPHLNSTPIDNGCFTTEIGTAWASCDVLITDCTLRQ